MKKARPSSENSEVIDDNFLDELRKMSSASVWIQHKQMIDFLAKSAEQGDKSSFALLVGLANEAIRRIQILTHGNFELASTVAQGISLWPVSLSLVEQLSISQRQLIAQLKLGTKDSFPLKTVKVDKAATVSRQIAFRLIVLTQYLRFDYEVASFIQEKTLLKTDLLGMVSDVARQQVPKYKSALNLMIQALDNKDENKGPNANTAGRILATLNQTVDSLTHILRIEDKPSLSQIRSYAETASNLPPLSKMTINKWFGFGKQMVLLLASGHPESNPVLRELGEYRQDAYYRKDVNTRQEFEKRKQAASAKATEEANIRDGLFQRIKSAYLVQVKDEE